jgi:hypothetical protein
VNRAASRDPESAAPTRRIRRGNRPLRAAGLLSWGLLTCGLLAACQVMPARTPPAGTAEEAATGSADDQPGAERAPAATTLDIDPEALLGKGPAAVTRLLGKPDMERIEQPALIWQYRGAECVVDLFFYPEPGGDPAAGKAVVYLEARDREVSQIAARGCLNRLAAGRQKAQL